MILDKFVEKCRKVQRANTPMPSRYYYDFSYDTPQTPNPKPNCMDTVTDQFSRYFDFVEQRKKGNVMKACEKLLKNLGKGFGSCLGLRKY